MSGESLRRSAPGGRLISLNEARRTRPGSSVRPLGRVERGLVIPWPWGPQEDESDEIAARRFPRLPRIPEIPQLGGLDRWLPTVYFVGGIIGLILLALVLRAILMGVAGGGAPAEEPSAAVQQAPAIEVFAPPLVPTPQIRFEVRLLQPTYTVVAGDTLSGIAQRFNTTTATVRGMNNLSEDAILNVGQRLIIP